MSTRLRRAYVILMTVALLLAVVTVIGAAWVMKDAQMIQRVEPATDAGATLFGDAGTNTTIGSQQLLIVRDEAAFLPGSGLSEARLVNERYLRENGLYPLQVKTVRFIRDMILAATLTLLAAAMLHWVWEGRRSRT